MSNPVGTPRYITFRTSRDTLGLVVAAGAMTFAMSYAVHSRHARSAAVPVPAPSAQEAQAPQQDWAGHLAELVPAAVTQAEPLTSAALVVPKSALALPQPPTRPKPARQCGDAACLAGKAAPGAPPKRQLVAAAEPRAESVSEAPRKKGLLHQLNPLTHLPDISMVGRPFTYAGGAVAGWFKRL